MLCWKQLSLEAEMDKKETSILQSNSKRADLATILAKSKYVPLQIEMVPIFTH